MKCLIYLPCKITNGAQVVNHIADFFSYMGTGKAKEHLEKLRDLRDNNIHKSLTALASTETSLEEASKLAKVHCC